MNKKRRALQGASVIKKAAELNSAAFLHIIVLIYKSTDNI